MRYAVIGSGSSANSYIFESGEDLFIIDNGFSLKQFKTRVAELGFNYNKIKAVFLTHMHSDHSKGIGALSRDLEIPVYAHKSIQGDFYIHKRVEPTKHYIIGNLNIMPFELSHDSPHSISYYLKINQSRVTLITDTGVITSQMYELARRSNILFLEANYNIDLLKESAYPHFLKRRISSDVGHLSNNAAITLLNDLSRDEKCNISLTYMCHMSKNSNNKEVLQKDFDNIYSGSIKYIICGRDKSVLGKSHS